MPKIPKNQPSAEENAASTNGAAPAAETPAAPASKRAGKSAKSVKSAKAPAAKKSGAKKKSAPRAAKKTGTKQSKPATQQSDVAEPTDEQIQLRAYFIAERRVQLSLPGDAATDWLQAREELVGEARQARS